jgi:hypothetical protein
VLNRRPIRWQLQTTVMTNRHFQALPVAEPPSPPAVRFTAGHLLVVLRRHRIACSIDSFSANGWTARLGDPSAGLYSQQGHFRSRQDAAQWLLDEAQRRGAVTVTGDRAPARRLQFG